MSPHVDDPEAIRAKAFVETIRRQFAIAVRFPRGEAQIPDIVSVCKKCAWLYFTQNTFDLHRQISDHMRAGCYHVIVGQEFSAELEKVLRALEDKHTHGALAPGKPRKLR